MARRRSAALQRAMQYVTPIDYQRARVYRWEAAAVYRNPRIFRPPAQTAEGLTSAILTPTRLLKWANGATDYLGIRPVQSISVVDRYNPLVQMFRRRIFLPEWALQIACVAHEVAHLGEWTTKHPPAWVRCYIDLLAREGLDKRWLLAIAKQFGVKV